MSVPVLPRCLHGNPWNACRACLYQVWCEDCGNLIELDEREDDLPRPKDTFTCSPCVDRMISAPRRVVG